MVRTRHSGELEGVDSPKLLSLDNEKEKYRSSLHTKRELPVETEDNYPRGAYQDDEYDIFEDKVVESRLRPRTGPRRAYNYLDADSSDDDRGRRHRRHSPHKEGKSPRSIKKELMEECGRRSRQMPSRLSLYETDVQEDNHQLRRSQRQIRHQSIEDHSFEQHARSRGERRTLTIQNGDDDTDNDGQKDESEDDKEQDSDDEEAKDQDSDNEDDGGDSQGYSDMYSRVKRKRVRRSLAIYDEVPQNTNNNRRDDSEEEEESSIRRSKRIYKKREVPQIVKSYSLREHKPRTDLYKAPVEERKIKKPTTSIFEVTPTKKTSRQPYQSPAQRRKSRKRSAAMHSSSSSTSSSSGESSDEKSFRKRKAKSMAKARSRMMPMNFSNTAPPSGIVKDRVKSGASLADVEPMNIDKNITFDSIGGLGKHIRALKEMVVFPLLYDKVFQKFNVDPPRGVLFYGPPGTGKTLVARALANECSHGDKKVAFFMRKGADCLSKWVGESERQLRLLFDQAFKYRPSIIFFDEIDGLAPVRSSRQDQIHSSIVSTLLALMDGLDSRGEIVVIGATNRIDSLDPALRRPGRFDREFLFPLPTLDARKQILKIHTSTWNPKLNERFLAELAEKCVGYCGADLKSLCTEAAMLALRRRYPQIYISNEALQLDESAIQVCAKDFFNAVSNIIPTSRRSVNSPGRPLSLHIFPLLERQLNKAVSQLCDTFPPCLMNMASLDAAATNKQAQEQTDAAMLLDDLASDEDEDAPSIFVTPSSRNSRFQAKKSLEGASTSKLIDTYLNFASFATHQPTTFRPRVMLTGFSGQGQTSYIAPALIHKMEDLPVHVLDLPALYAVTAKTPEESCANVFHEARRKCPSIIYMPYINQWWDVLGDTLRTTLLTLIQDLNPTTPLLLLATSEQPYSCLDIQLKSLFNEMSGEVVKMSNPNADERKAFFKDLLLQHSCKAPPQKKTAAKRMLEVLPKAAPVTPKELTNQEMNALLEKEELTLMELRIFLRDVLHKLGSDKKFSIFTKPVNIENAPDYYEVIENPMDMSTMMSKIDCHEYSTVRSFMDDVDLICSNALEYNPDRGPMDKVIRHRACALKDTAYAIIKTELDKEFEKMCVEIEESRKRRGLKSTTVPNFYRTKPVAQNGEPSSRSATIPSYLDSTRPARSIPKPDGERFSRRVRGLKIDPTPSLEDVERKKSTYQATKGEEGDEDGVQSSSQVSNVEGEESVLSQEMNSDNESSKEDTGAIDSVEDSERLPQSHHTGAQTDPLHKKSRNANKCVWCRPSRRRRRKIFQDHMSSARKMTPNAAKSGKEDKKTVNSQQPPVNQPSVNQPLNIDVSESTEAEIKSPVRKSARIVSPPALPAGVTTRRQSLSPRASRPSVETKLKDLPLEENPIQETAVNEELDESQQEVTDKSNESVVPEKKNQTDSADVSELLGKKLETLQDTTVDSETEAKKLSVVKSLDLDFGVVDSGAGSSLEGNGDSRDSMDNKAEEAQPATSSSHAKDYNENNKQDTSHNDSSIFDESSNKLVVPTQKLSNLLDQLVATSEGFNVECLEKIYSQLSQIIFKHRHSYNRSDMVNELEKRVTEMTRQLPSLSSSR